jgi:hypothetical protein
LIPNKVFFMLVPRYQQLVRNEIGLTLYFSYKFVFVIYCEIKIEFYIPNAIHIKGFQLNFYSVPIYPPNSVVFC